jgi:DNA mismatch endonuclease (patch repair protein)
MRNTPTKDTPAELAIRQLLHRRGLRYRVDFRPEPTIRRKADIVFTRSRVAVFVDGCFWHDCPRHGSSPTANADWWRAKLDGNVARDRDTDARLTAAGWTVLRFWEHEPPAAAVERIIEIVHAKRSRHLHNHQLGGLS